MARERSPHELLQDLCRRDARYPLEAYEFLYATLGFVQQRFKEQGQHAGPGPNHVTGQQLAEGCRDLALQEFGLMARAVFRAWNVNRTDDIGEMIYNLIDTGLMSKTDADRKEDFHAVYDMDQALAGYRIRLGE